MPKRKASFSSHDGCHKRSSASHIGNQSTGTTSLLHYASGQLGPETLSVGGSNHEHLPDTSQPLDRNIIHIDQWQSLRNNRDEETRIFQALMRYSLSQNVEPNNASAVPVPYDVENTASLMGAVDQSTLSSGIELPRPETVRVPQMTCKASSFSVNVPNTRFRRAVSGTSEGSRPRQRNCWSCKNNG